MAIDREKLIELRDTAVKGIAGTALAVTAFGHPAAALLAPAFQEAVGLTLLNLGRKRTNDMLTALSERVKNIESTRFEDRFKDEKFLDMFVEGVHQAQRAISQQRIEYIASILGRCLNEEELDHIAARRMMSILAELNDVEVIYFLSKRQNGVFQNEFQQQFGDYFSKAIRVYDDSPLAGFKEEPYDREDSSQEDVDREALLDSYEAHLIQSGLLQPVFRQALSMRGEVARSPETKIGVDVTALGNLLLKYIEFDSGSD